MYQKILNSKSRVIVEHAHLRPFNLYYMIPNWRLKLQEFVKKFTLTLLYQNRPYAGPVDDIFKKKMRLDRSGSRNSMTVGVQLEC